MLITNLSTNKPAPLNQPSLQPKNSFPTNQFINHSIHQPLNSSTTQFINHLSHQPINTWSHHSCTRSFRVVSSPINIKRPLHSHETSVCLKFTFIQTAVFHVKRYTNVAIEKFTQPLFPPSTSSDNLLPLNRLIFHFFSDSRRLKFSFMILSIPVTSRKSLHTSITATPNSASYFSDSLGLD